LPRVLRACVRCGVRVSIVRTQSTAEKITGSLFSVHQTIIANEMYLIIEN